MTGKITLIGALLAAMAYFAMVVPEKERHTTFVPRASQN
jgi:hypothetical protein